MYKSSLIRLHGLESQPLLLGICGEDPKFSLIALTKLGALFKEVKSFGRVGDVII